MTKDEAKAIWDAGWEASAEFHRHMDPCVILDPEISGAFDEWWAAQSLPDLGEPGPDWNGGKGGLRGPCSAECFPGHCADWPAPVANIGRK